MSAAILCSRGRSSCSDHAGRRRRPGPEPLRARGCRAGSERLPGMVAAFLIPAAGAHDPAAG